MVSQNDFFSEKELYCFDASSLINLRNFYPKDIFISLNKQFTDVLHSGKICIINMVMEELKKDNKPELYDFIKGNISNNKIRKYESFIHITQQIIKKHYDNKGKSHELKADPHVIACAKEEQLTVVTDELGGGLTQIPHICLIEKVNCISIVDFFRKEKIKS
ncbi:MAG: hypothetical protein US11_C0001G0018 [Candidatus Roizmanbacteria bacterium GW2011_GWA2_36_23]|uniref:DUF4411 domain-containing protein n=1 Tax=Candidatus Roizmanbacteria bacterium GW2011_GWA2_36_23 TaxID=1618480 RepID=A0A0G0GQI3_9BACT|nr:MAG: hypothetical protein US11_C0001G0018 [Candidatus Roizmanbacteria bacterium GW2011_GWA2_36_23]